MFNLQAILFKIIRTNSIGPNPIKTTLLAKGAMMRSSLPPPLLVAEQLTIGYRHGRHIRPVTTQLQLQASPSQIIALLGPNGSGKSTLLRTLAGMQPPLAGQVLLNGRPLASLTPSQRATQLAVVLTEAPDANLTVYDLVATGRYPYTGWFGRTSEEDERAISRALRQTNTQNFAHRPIGTLSDGEQQKVMIARAVAQDTPLLILDEPTAYLDVPNRVAVLQLLLCLAHEHQKTVLLSTHALDLALLMADQLWLMRAGELQAGVPEDMVLRGAVAAVFERKGIAFDRQTGTFAPPRAAGPPIRVEGSGPEALWTQRALERSGYTVVADTGRAPVVRVIPGPPRRWIIESDAGQRDAPSIEALLEHLAALKMP